MRRLHDHEHRGQFATLAGAWQPLLSRGFATTAALGLDDSRGWQPLICDSASYR
jgi:hypothetical protein